MNILNVKFRCHSLGKLMTDSRDAITDKQLATIDELVIKQQTKPLTANQAAELDRLIKKRDNPTLSETCTKELVDVYLWYRYGRRRDIANKYITKGLHVEEDSITLINLVRGGDLLRKNETRYTDPDLTGLPDIVEEVGGGVEITDAKSSWDLHTFTSAVVEPLDEKYEWQVRGYMRLLNHHYGKRVCSQAHVVHALIDTPPLLIEDAKNKLRWQMGVIDPEASPDYMAGCDAIEHAMTFLDIPRAERVHRKTVAWDPAKEVEISDRVRRCREYMVKTWPDFFDPSKDNQHPASR